MYPRNAASPERILVGQVVLISDGTVQSSGVSITVRGQGGAEAAGGGTTAYSASDNSVYYTPTQAETNFTSFTVIAYKASCFSASITVVTTASVTPGYAGIDWAKVTNQTTTVDLSATSINVVDVLTGHTAQTGDSFARIGVAGAGLTNINLPNQTMDIVGTITGNLSGSVGSVTGAVGSVTAGVTVSTNSDKTGYSLTQAFPSNFADMSISVTTGLVDITQTAADKTWSTGTRVLTAGTNISLAKGVGVTGFTDLSAAQVNAEVDTALTDYDSPTNTEMVAAFTEIKGATWATTDTLEAIRDRGDAAWITGAGGTPPQLLQNTTIATLASQTSFTLTAGSADDDAYNGAVVVVTDQSTSTQKAVGSVSDYTGSTKTVTLSADPAIFTMATGDTIDIIANASTAPTAAAVADAVWDEATSGHNVAGSFGKAIRQTNEGTIAIESTINDAGATTTTFITALTETTDNHYKDSGMVFIDGALVGQTRPILSYNGTSKTIVLDEALTEAPANGDGFIIKTNHVHTITEIQAGLATEAKQDIIDTNVDAILLDTGTTLPATLTTIDTVVDGIQTDLDNATDGLGAIKTAVDSRMAEASINTTGGAVDVVTLVTTTTTNTDMITAADLMPTQNAIFNNIEFLWVAASDHVTPVTGATTTSVTRSIDGGAFGSATGTLAEVGNGIYQFDASAADMNGGIITFRFVATGGTPGAPDDAFITIVTSGGV